MRGDKSTKLYLLKNRDWRSLWLSKRLDFQTATFLFFKQIIELRLKRKVRKYLLTTYALNKLHCALGGNIPRQHNTSVEIVYFHPPSCHHSSILLPANTMTLFLRQLGNVLVITPPNHVSAKILCTENISHLSSDQCKNKEGKQTKRAVLTHGQAEINAGSWTCEQRISYCGKKRNVCVNF